MDANNLEFWKTVQGLYLEDSDETYFCRLGCDFGKWWYSHNEFHDAVKDHAVEFWLQYRDLYSDFTIITFSNMLFTLKGEVGVISPREREIRISFLEWIISRLETANQ